MMTDSAENWPVFSHTVRNIGSICSRYLDFIGNACLHIDETLQSKLQCISKMAKHIINFEFNFRIICTVSDETNFQLTKRLKTKFARKYDVWNGDGFVPTLVIGSNKDVNYILKCTKGMLNPAMVLLLTGAKKEVDLPADLPFEKHMLTTVATVEDVFAKVDENLFERLVFQLACSMVNTLQTVFQNTSDSERGKHLIGNGCLHTESRFKSPTGKPEAGGDRRFVSVLAPVCLSARAQNSFLPFKPG